MDMWIATAIITRTDVSKLSKLQEILNFGEFIRMYCNIINVIIIVFVFLGIVVIILSHSFIYTIYLIK